MSMMSTGLGDDERRSDQDERRGALSSQWDGRDAFTVEETGQILGISRASAFAAAKKGEIPTIRIGKRLIVPRRALEKLLGADEDALAGGQKAFQVVEVPSAPVAPAPQRVEVAIQILAAAPRGRSRKGASTTMVPPPTATSAESVAAE
jgi:Helix-turn-helix domain